MSLVGRDRDRYALEAIVKAQGRRSSLRSILLFGGPTVVASLAYMDPGNYATNIEAGSSYGYKLLWWR